MGKESFSQEEKKRILSERSLIQDPSGFKLGYVVPQTLGTFCCPRDCIISSNSDVIDAEPDVTFMIVVRVARKDDKSLLYLQKKRKIERI